MHWCASFYHACRYRSAISSRRREAGVLGGAAGGEGVLGHLEEFGFDAGPRLAGAFGEAGDFERAVEGFEPFDERRAGGSGHPDLG